MRYWKKTLAASFIITLMIACDKPEEKEISSPSPWLGIDGDKITGAFNKDRFPVVENPDYLSIDETSFLDNGSTVYVLKLEDEVYIFPWRSLAAEVINQEIAGYHVAVTFCPKTLSGIAWNREINGEVHTFAASGFLYRDNLMPYDLETESIWSQMLLRGVNGTYSGRNVSTFSLFETSWKTASTAFPHARVLPEVNWLKSTKSVFDLEPDENPNLEYAIPNGERMAGIFLGGSVLIIPNEPFDDKISLHRINRFGANLLIAGNKSSPFITVFYVESNSVFSPIQDAFPVIMSDEDGNVYNCFGEVIEGPNKGDKLSSPPFYLASGWAWKAIIPGLEIAGSL
jgi:hypothetical protein